MKEDLPSLNLHRADMEKYSKRALQLAWKLATAVPPLIASCGPKVFSDVHHEKASTAWDDQYVGNYTLRYLCPVLFNFSGGVQIRGCVANANLDAGKSLNM